MAQQHTVSLVLGSISEEITNYDSYEIQLDMLQPGSPWQFALWHSASGNSAWHRFVPKIKLGDKVMLSIDGAVQLNGRIEEMRVGAGPEGGASITISGRDLSGVAQDWDADPRTRLYKRVLGDALEALFVPLGIPVVIGANADAAREVQSRVRRGTRGSTSAATTASGRHHRKHRTHKVDLSHPRPGERIWQVADSICRKMGFMMWVAPSGNGELAVIVDTPNYDQFPVYAFERRLLENGHVTQESNILEGWLHAQIRDVPTQVYAMGRAPRGDQKPSRHVVGMTRRSIFARPLFDDRAFWARSGLPGLLDAPEDLAYEGPRFGKPPEQATSASEQTAGSTSERTAARSPIGTLQPFQNEGLAQSNLVISPLPPQPRFLHTKRSRDPATGEQEAKRIHAAAMKRFRTYTATVQGHGQTVIGDLYIYAVNSMAKVFDNLIGLDEDMLITGVKFKGSRKPPGQVTELTLGTRGAIAINPDD